MKYTQPSIPTKYNGRQYRSRLEARWACMFDLLGWRFEYEPCDLMRWIPDFAICEAQTIYVEVKPVMCFPKDVAYQIDHSDCEEEALIVGATVPIPNDLNAPCIGWLREDMWWEPASFGRWTGSESEAKNEHGRIGFCHTGQSFIDRITGCYDGGSSWF